MKSAVNMLFWVAVASATSPDSPTKSANSFIYGQKVQKVFIASVLFSCLVVSGRCEQQESCLEQDPKLTPDVYNLEFQYHSDDEIKNVNNEKYIESRNALFTEIYDISWWSFSMAPIFKVETDQGSFALKLFHPYWNGWLVPKHEIHEFRASYMGDFLRELRFMKDSESNQFTIRILDYHAGTNQQMFDEGLLFRNPYLHDNLYYFSSQDETFFEEVRARIGPPLENSWAHDIVEYISQGEFDCCDLHEHSKDTLELGTDISEYPFFIYHWYEHGDFFESSRNVLEYSHKNHDGKNPEGSVLLHWLKLLLQPLEEIYKQNIQHKDIKDKNYLVSQVDEKGWPMELILADFGSARREVDITVSLFVHVRDDIFRAGLILLNAIKVKPHFPVERNFGGADDIHYYAQNLLRSLQEGFVQEPTTDSYFLVFLLQHVLHNRRDARPTASTVLQLLEAYPSLKERASKNGCDLGVLFNFFSRVLTFPHEMFVDLPEDLWFMRVELQQFNFESKYYSLEKQFRFFSYLSYYEHRIFRRKILQANERYKNIESMADYYERMQNERS